MTIPYTCVSCHAPLENGDSQEATPDECPVCGAHYTVPFKPIHFPCPGCGAKLTSPGALGGLHDTCPRCNEVCEVPLSRRQKGGIRLHQQEELKKLKAAEKERRREEDAARKAATQQAELERLAREAEKAEKESQLIVANEPQLRAPTGQSQKSKRGKAMVGGSISSILALLVILYFMSRNGTLSNLSPALNPISLQGPMNEILQSDIRNEGIKVSVYFGSAIDSSVLVFDLTEVSETNSMVDVFRVFLQYAERISSKSFSEVRLAYRGAIKFSVAGSYFQELGRTYSTENPVYIIRTFPSHLRTPSGIEAYGTWEGGILAVTEKQMDDFADFHRKWYIEAR